MNRGLNDSRPRRLRAWWLRRDEHAGAALWIVFIAAVLLFGHALAALFNQL